ncbi:hypothetical protein [Pseudomonas caspiana]|uniref:hypothetical protein n=1 Tax=Pseudomonas caspiana TaxID=1451454 RepID=UPI0011981FCA|nr:hypothetical protein [Pseudomonas caspiana]
MPALARNLVFILFPLSLAALGYSVEGFRDNPADALGAYGLPPVVMYFVALMAVGTFSLCLAGLGKLLERQSLLGSGKKVVLRLLCYSPLLLSACLTALVSATHALNSTAGCAALVLSLVSAATVLYWLIRGSTALLR